MYNPDVPQRIRSQQARKVHYIPCDFRTNYFWVLHAGGGGQLGALLHQGQWVDDKRNGEGSLGGGTMNFGKYTRLFPPHSQQIFPSAIPQYTGGGPLLLRRQALRETALKRQYIHRRGHLPPAGSPERPQLVSIQQKDPTSAAQDWFQKNHDSECPLGT
eukprot:gene13199-biopygen14075